MFGRIDGRFWNKDGFGLLEVLLGLSLGSAVLVCGYQLFHMFHAVTARHHDRLNTMFLHQRLVRRWRSDWEDAAVAGTGVRWVRCRREQALVFGTAGRESADGGRVWIWTQVVPEVVHRVGIRRIPHDGMKRTVYTENAGRFDQWVLFRRRQIGAETRVRCAGGPGDDGHHIETEGYGPAEVMWAARHEGGLSWEVSGDKGVDIVRLQGRDDVEIPQPGRSVLMVQTASGTARHLWHRWAGGPPPE